MKSKLSTLKEYRAILKTLSKNELINLCIDWLRKGKSWEHSVNVETANEIVEYVGVPEYMGGITPKQALKQIKDLGFSLKEIEEMFPKDIHHGLWEK